MKKYTMESIFTLSGVYVIFVFSPELSKLESMLSLLGKIKEGLEGNLR